MSHAENHPNSGSPTQHWAVEAIAAAVILVLLTSAFGFQLVKWMR